MDAGTTAASMADVLTEVTTTLFGSGGVIPTVWGWATGDALPFFVIGIAVSLALVGVKIIRSVVWGA